MIEGADDIDEGGEFVWNKAMTKYGFAVKDGYVLDPDTFIFKESDAKAE